MPLVERGGPQVNEKAKESKEAAQLSEAAPVPTETQVRGPGDPWGKSMVRLPYPALTLLPSPQASKLLNLLDLLDGPSENAQHPPPLDPTPGDTLIHLLDLPCTPLPSGKPQQRGDVLKKGWWK